MAFHLQTFSYAIVTICIISFKYFVLFFFPFKELIRGVRAAQGIQNADIMARLESFERTVVTLWSEKTSKDNDRSSIDNTSINANINVANTDSSSSNATNKNASTSNTSNNNTASKATSPPLNSPSSSSRTGRIPYESLKAKVNHIREQSNAAALDLSDKIDNLKDENQALKAHIIALGNQLAEKIGKADNTYNIMTNRIDILEHYVQNDTKFEIQRKHEIQEVQVLSQKNTDLINGRINTVEEQLAKSLKEFEDRRSQKIQSFSGTFKSLRKHCDDLKMELDQQVQLTANQGKEIAMNTATMKETLSSDALSSLGKSVRDAMDLCKSKLTKMEAEREILQATMKSTDEDLKTLKERIVDLETEFDDTREEVRNDLTKMEEKIVSMAQDIVDIVRELGIHYGVLGSDGKSLQEARDNTDETF